MSTLSFTSREVRNKHSYGVACDVAKTVETSSTFWTWCATNVTLREQRRTGGHIVRSSFCNVACRVASCVRTFVTDDSSLPASIAISMQLIHLFLSRFFPRKCFGEHEVPLFSQLPFWNILRRLLNLKTDFPFLSVPVLPVFWSQAVFVLQTMRARIALWESYLSTRVPLRHRSREWQRGRFKYLMFTKSVLSFLLQYSTMVWKYYFIWCWLYSFLSLCGYFYRLEKNVKYVKNHVKIHV